MRRFIVASMSLSALLLSSAPLLAQQATFDRLPDEILDVVAPSARVSGEPGNMRIADRSCRSWPRADVRSRIVNTVVQEWAFFGFSVEDMTRYSSVNARSGGDWRRRSRMSAAQAAQVAGSIGGYWAAAPESGWILQRQNDSWQARGIGTRWRNPWSAAFISWVMCESGLGDAKRFERAIAHHNYIDQAILAREQAESDTAYVAYDPAEFPIEPGDMLCRGSRPAYRSIAERRAQLGVGARTHCDIVVKLDPAHDQIMVIGGNVGGSVRMKLLPAGKESGEYFEALPYNGRQIFAHLKLRADPVAADALERSPTFQAINCSDSETPASASIASLLLAPQLDCYSELP